MPDNERKTEVSNHNNRRPWPQRNGWLITGLFGFLITISGVAIKVWAQSNTAFNTVMEVREEQKSNRSTVAAVPHLKEKLNVHVDDFKDFRTEQRVVNASLNDKLDYLVRVSQTE